MHTDPLVQFRKWFDEARTAEPALYEAMTLATATADGKPSARMVLLKSFDEDGFVFYTNLESRKAAELAENPRAALLFHWKSLGRQVRIEGTVEAISRATSERYFATRPRNSRLAAWASPQSRAIPDRAFLERRVAEVDRSFAHGDVPLPPFWGGYRVRPDRIEFWVNRDDRLHDRFLYVLKRQGGWARSRLAP
ncbi:MAG TPA: pyridoxamine 5'-phosphate oxidase [Candidatus Eisenbacteria bacterium]|nr:pyridoxamine 5'-phosphate oxidase [Candidatus Eisenbacteria bacterium]